MALDVKGSTMVNLEWSETVTRNGTLNLGTKSHGNSARMESEARMQSDWDWIGTCLMEMGRLESETFSTRSMSVVETGKFKMKSPETVELRSWRLG